MTETSSRQSTYADKLRLYNAYMEPVYRAALAELALLRGSSGLDVGCGPGRLYPLLDEVTGGVGRIVGVDISRSELAAAGEHAKRHGLEGRVGLVCADLRQPLPFPDDTFDWAWSADTLYPVIPLDMDAIIRELARVVKPGGWITIFYGQIEDREVLLPGYSRLERLVRTAHALVSRGFAPERDPDSAIAWLRKAGLQNVSVSVHTAVHHAPLDERVLGCLEGYVLHVYRSISRERLEAVGMTDEEWETWRAITDPKAEAYLLRQPNYYCVSFALLTRGQVP
jgi:ubiquinone/menaquinone biosynthesis C-methylase UbiE